MSRDYAFEASHERWEMAILDDHLDGEEEDEPTADEYATNPKFPFCKNSAGRWYEPEAGLYVSKQVVESEFQLYLRNGWLK